MKDSPTPAGRTGMELSSRSDASWYATAEEFLEVRAELTRTHQKLLSAVRAFPVEQWESDGSDGSWSAGKIVEHIFMAQRILRNEILAHLQDPARPELLAIMDEQRTKLVRLLPDGGKAQAGKQSTAFRGLRPESVAGEIASAEHQFSILFETAEAQPIKAIGWESPFFGKLSGLLWMLYLALHTDRHVRQLERLNDSLASPPRGG